MSGAGPGALDDGPGGRPGESPVAAPAPAAAGPAAAFGPATPGAPGGEPTQDPAAASGTAGAEPAAAAAPPVEVRRWRAFLVKVAFAIVGAGILGTFIIAAGPAEIARELGRFGWTLPLLLLPYTAVYLLDGLGWRLAFERPPAISFARLFAIKTAGESVSYTLPTGYIGGEPVKVLLCARFGVPALDGTASVIVAKTAQIVAQIVFLVFGIAAFAHALPDRPAGVLWASLGFLAAGAAVVWLLLAWQRTGVTRPLRALSDRTGLGRGILETQRASLERLDEALKRLYHGGRRRFLASSAAFLLGWIAGAFEVYLFAYLLELPLTFEAAFAIEALAKLGKGAGFFIPGGLGAQEGGVLLLFLAFGLDSATAVAFSVVQRGRELLWIAAGYAIMAALGLRPRDAVGPSQEVHHGGTEARREAPRSNAGQVRGGDARGA